MQKEIIPKLYRLTAISSHDSFCAIYTEASVANKVESDMWDNGGVTGSLIDYADESIDGIVIWKTYRKG
jgi:hypothetical protein